MTIAVIIIGAILVYFKSFMGMNFADETYYLALLYRFAQGDCPFLHEWHPTQTYAILLYPLYNFYVWIIGSNEGVMLAARLLMNTITFLAVLAIYQLLKKRGVGWFEQIVIALLQLFYTCNGILGLSYYMVAYEALLLAVVLQAFNDDAVKGREIRDFFSGVLTAVAILGNPFLVFFLIPQYIYYGIQIVKKKQIREMMMFTAGGGMIAAITLMLVAIHTDSLIAVIQNIPMLLHEPIHPVDGSFLVKTLYTAFHEYFFFHGYIIYGVAIALTLYRILRRKTLSLLWKRVYFLIQTGYMLLMVGRNIVLSDDLGDVIYVIGFYFLLLLPLVDHIKGNGWKLGFVTAGAALLVSFLLASRTGWGAGSCGSILIVMGGVLLLRDILSGLYTKKWIAAMGMGVILLPMLMTTIYWKMYTNWSDKFSVVLPYRLTVGPAMGIYTTEATKNYYEAMIRVSEEIDEDAEKYMVTNKHLFYLISDNRCGAYTACYDGHVQTERTELYYTMFPERIPDHIIAFDGIESFPEYMDWSHRLEYKSDGTIDTEAIPVKVDVLTRIEEQ